jgi:hypothetical protein
MFFQDMTATRVTADQLGLIDDILTDALIDRVCLTPHFVCTRVIVGSHG